MTNPLIIANWKMNHNLSETSKFLSNFNYSSINNSVDVVFCPPMTSIFLLNDFFSNTHIKIGAQNCYYGNTGAFTGEIAPSMLKSSGCEYVIVGHSERRSIFSEDSELIANKICSILEFNMIPILCVGEDLLCRKSSSHFQFIKQQLTETLSVVNSSHQNYRIVIAYEPIWAIGTGLTPSVDDIQAMHEYIKSQLCQLNISKNLFSILYGGSVNENNCVEIYKAKDVNGFLVGGASLDPNRFLSLIHAIT